jgi:hypothetical protein
VPKKPVHNTPRGDEGWAVIREGNSRASSIYPTQAEAAQAVREVAHRDRTEILIHGRNGQIRKRDFHEHDPFPPPG